MSEAFDYREDLRQWVDQLTPAQARHLRLVISQDDELPEVTERAEPSGEDEDEGGLPASFLALFGSINAPADYAERHDDYVRERMERHLGEAE